MKFILSLISWISRAGAIMAAAIVAAMTIHILLEILLRAVFKTSTYALDEFVGYGVAAATFLALGYTLETDGHIRVGLLLSRLGNGLLRLAVELLCVIVALVLTVFIWQYFWFGVSRNWSRGAVSETMAQIPLWIPESFVLLGLSILSLQLAGLALRILAERSVSRQETADPHE